MTLPITAKWSQACLPKAHHCTLLLRTLYSEIVTVQSKPSDRFADIRAWGLELSSKGSWHNGGLTFEMERGGAEVRDRMDFK